MLSRVGDLVGHRNPATEEKPDLIAVSLEFDESRSKTRYRSGILDVEAVYPILATWQICLEFHTSVGSNVK